MTDTSPLEIEAVRERLEKLEKERQGLSDLANELKELRAAMSASMAGLEQKRDEAEQWSNDLKSVMLTLDADGHALKQELLQSLRSFQEDSQRALQAASEALARWQNDDGAQLRDSPRELDLIVNQLRSEFHEKLQTMETLGSDLDRSIAGEVHDKIEALESSAARYKKASIEHAQSLAEKLNNAIAELHRAFNSRASDLDNRFEKFSSKHFEHMEQINKVYRRMHVAYDTFHSSVNAMEVSVENETKAMQRQVREMEEKVQAEQDSNELRIAAITDALKRTMGDTLGKFQQQIHEEVNEISLQNSELQNLLDSRDETVHARMQQMWLGVMLCAFIALAAFILSRF